MPTIQQYCSHSVGSPLPSFTEHFVKSTPSLCLTLHQEVIATGFNPSLLLTVHVQVGAADYHHTMAGIGGLQTQGLGQQKQGLSLGGLGEICCIVHSLPIVLWCHFISCECQISEVHSLQEYSVCYE